MNQKGGTHNVQTKADGSSDGFTKILQSKLRMNWSGGRR